MEKNEILLYYSLKYSGNWEKIFNALSENEEIDEKEAKKLISNVHSKYITFFSPEYPESLKHGYRPPFVIYYHGDISLLSDDYKKIAVVGARENTEYGEKYANYFIKNLVDDFVIVSGMAVGTDACAHRSAFNNGGKTIAVLGCGINVCYLRCNLDIYEKCKEKHLVISEYPDLTSPRPKNFPIRNRIIVGLSEAALIVEGKINSGTQITATLMAEKNGNVCCIPTKLGEDSICNHLIAEGAYLVEEPKDIYEIIGMIPKRPIFEK